MRLYRFAVFLLVFFLAILFFINLSVYFKLKRENEALKREYERLTREYGELLGLKKKLLEMGRDGKVRGDNVP